MISQADIKAKEQEYREYIDTHRANVAKAWEEVKFKCNSVLKERMSLVQFSLVESDIANHDLSKYSEEEFDAYRKWFHFVDESEKDKAAFDKAWEHHYMNNPHHPNSWVKNNSKDLMPYVYIVQMVCDWQAMGYVFGNNAKEYYEKNKAEIQGKLGERQIKWTEELLNVLCE